MQLSRHSFRHFFVFYLINKIVVVYIASWQEDDDNRLMIDEAETSWEINKPGVHSTACVDITLNSLPIAAIIYADEIQQIESQFDMSLHIR